MQKNENCAKLMDLFNFLGIPLYLVSLFQEPYRPWAVSKNYFISWHPSEKHLVYGLFEGHIDTLLPKKVPKPKTCPILRKRLICHYLILNYITAKNCDILHSTKTTIGGIFWFFYSLNSL